MRSLRRLDSTASSPTAATTATRAPNGPTSCTQELLTVSAQTLSPTRLPGTPTSRLGHLRCACDPRARGSVPRRPLVGAAPCRSGRRQPGRGASRRRRRARVPRWLRRRPAALRRHEALAGARWGVSLGDGRGQRRRRVRARGGHRTVGGAAPTLDLSSPARRRRLLRRADDVLVDRRQCRPAGRPRTCRHRRRLPCCDVGGRHDRRRRRSGGDQAVGALMLTLVVTVAAGLGAVSRYAVDRVVTRRRRGAFPAGTFLVNVSGSLLLGLVTGFVLHHGTTNDVGTVVGAGFAGGYTTFSTWAWECLALVETGERRTGAAYGIGSFVAGLVAAAAGLGLALV